MNKYADTIYALSSGPPPAGLAVIRMSGNGVRYGLETITGRVPPPRHATLVRVSDETGLPIDDAIVLFFEGPRSFTGEDCAELHVHGGRAVVAAVLDCLGRLAGFRMAEAGEFTRRAFENGRLDLTEVEGLADLIGAETEMQRRLALENMRGGLSALYEQWSRRLTRCRAMIEAEFDFSDEEDVAGSALDTALADLPVLAGEIEKHLKAGRSGEIVRDGFRIAIAGAPNAGKSSLMNALARRDVSIVSAEAGTTRDVITVHLDLGGYCVIVSDTAGLREATGQVEAEGIRRAQAAIADADLVLVLRDLTNASPDLEIAGDRPALVVGTKADLLTASRIDKAAVDIAISVRSGEGLSELLALLEERAAEASGVVSGALPTRMRQRHHLERCLERINAALEENATPLEIRAESLRQAADALGTLTGRVGVEDLLGVIFAEFCIGK